MKKLKIGILGIGHNHGAAKISELRGFGDEVEIAGVAESEKIWLKKRKSLKAYDGLTFMSEEELLSLPGLDAVFVETSVPRLVPAAEKCVKLGLHVHMDKPAGVDLKQYAKVLRTAKAKNLVFQTGYMYRYNEAFAYLRDAVKSGRLGRLYGIQTAMSTLHPKNFKEQLVSYGVKAPVMYIFGCHLMDAIVTLWGKPLSVTAFNKSTGDDGMTFEDDSFAVLDYGNGIASVKVSSSETNGYGRREITAYGEKGAICIRPIEGSATVYETVRREAEGRSWKSFANEVKLKESEGRYHEMISDFIAMIRGEKESQYTYEHELYIQALTLSACGYDIDLEKDCIL